MLGDFVVNKVAIDDSKYLTLINSYLPKIL